GNKETPPKTGNTTLTKTSTKNSSSREREYHLGSRGGCYYLTESGEKKYVDKKYCARTTEPKTEEPEVNEDKKTETETKPADKPESKDRTYTKGTRGGCYYINSSGKKIYVDKSLCN
ncbi:MAG: hypothetical protein M3384_06230, partial [Acidobacteriota bacterium]|nr:hypothetical protein [Acidobacteriota bacterium]